MKYRVVHKTEYSSSDPVSIGHNKGWLEPRTTPRQRVRQFHLDIIPAPSVRSSHVDTFGNPVWMFSFNEGYETLNITATSEVEIKESVPPPTSISCSAVRSLLRSPGPQSDVDVREFCFPSVAVHWTDQMQEWARESLGDDRPIIDGVRDLTARVYQEFSYDDEATEIDTPVTEVFETRRGVCQDFAHLQLALLRSMGLAARYVSGYLRTYPPPGKPRLIGADASHAWVSVFCGEPGWIDVDPTNNLFCGDEHITLAWGRDYHDVPPLAGVCVGGNTHQLKVNVDVEPAVA
jgi:transglutaminase-like putative cysteine protease